MTEPAQHEARRTRRYFALPGFVAVLVLVVAATASATTWVVHRHTVRTLAVAEDGHGSAPVLASPPPDGAAASDPTPTFGTAPAVRTPGVATSGPQDSETTSAQDALVTATATAGVPARAHGLQLILTSTLSDTLRPGFPRTLYVTVRNPDSVAVQLYRLDVRVGSPPAAGCLPAWVETGRYRYVGGAKEIVPAQASVIVDLPIELVDLVDVDQNACQGTTFPLTLSGVGLGTT